MKIDNRKTAETIWIYARDQATSNLARLDSERMVALIANKLQEAIQLGTEATLNSLGLDNLQAKCERLEEANRVLRDEARALRLIKKKYEESWNYRERLNGRIETHGQIIKRDGVQ